MYDRSNKRKVWMFCLRTVSNFVFTLKCSDCASVIAVPHPWVIFLQVLRAFGIPQKKHLYFISVSGAFLGTSLPPSPNWSRFDLFIVFFILFIVFLATHCILFIFSLAISFFESKVVVCLCSAYAYAMFMLMPCLCLCSVFPAWCVLPLSYLSYEFTLQTQFDL